MMDEPSKVSVPGEGVGSWELLGVWWRFFWRYAIVGALLLLGGGCILNFLSGILYDSRLLFILTLIYSSTANAAASLCVFVYILNRHFRRSAVMVSTAAGRPVFRAKLRAWFHYYWRFLLFSFGIALLSGALLPLAARWLGQEPLAFLKYSKYVGNVSMIPASLFAFRLLMRRKGGKQLLRISTCGGC